MRNFSLLLPAIMILSCISDNEPSFVGIYKGGWAESYWTIELKVDSTFLYKTEGHIGENRVEGKIQIKSDTLFLYPNASHHQDSMRFRILNESCIASLEYNIKNDVKWSYGYCKNKGEDWTSKKWNMETLNQMSDEH